MSRRRRRRPAAPAPAPRRAESAVPYVVALTLAAATLVVDVRAESPFDAPKRLAAGIGLAVAAALALWRGSRFDLERWRRLPLASRASALLVAAALAAAGVSAALSPRRAASLDSWRYILLVAVALPLGASLSGPGFRIAAIGFLSAAVVSALLAVGEAIGWRIPLPVVTVSGRSGTGAMLGNEGLLSIVLAIAAVAALAVLVGSERRGDRRLAAASLVLFAVVLVINRNLTSAVAVAAGAALVGLRLRGRQALKAGAALALAAAAAVALYPPARGRLREASAYLRAGDWNRLLSYREGPWVAAVEMIRERPLAGWGPGSFAAEFVPHRLKAEIRRRRRFVNPRAESAYLETHCDYLQAAAESGLPAAAAAAAAAAFLAAGILRRSRPGAADRAEAAGLAAVLCAGAVAALTWFPLQRPASSLPLLLAAGRSWRIVKEETAE